MRGPAVSSWSSSQRSGSLTTVFKVLVLPILLILLLRAVSFHPHGAQRHPQRHAGVFVAPHTVIVSHDDASPSSASGEVASFLKRIDERASAAERARLEEEEEEERLRRQEEDRRREEETQTKREEVLTTKDEEPRVEKTPESGSPSTEDAAVKKEEPPPKAPDASAITMEECVGMLKRHSVVPKHSWGSLKKAKRKRWTELDCDEHVGEYAPPVSPPVTKKQKKKSTKDAPPPNPRKKQGGTGVKSPRAVTLTERCASRSNETEIKSPVVALCCGTTTRTKKGWIGRVDELDSLALFRHLLPSFKRTADCGFRYLIVVGYDAGDRFWDDGGAARGADWVSTHVTEPLRKERNVHAELLYSRVENTVKKPGPVFTAITQRAFRAGADYIYRVNDDTELATPWASAFVSALISLQNVGVVGPSCEQGNRRILTHDFTHRKHMEVFEEQYYPPALSDWWMDDWISRVYGADRTLLASHIYVVHHTFHHGQRYTVDSSHQSLLDGLVRDGRFRVRGYLRDEKRRRVLHEKDSSSEDNIKKPSSSSSAKDPPVLEEEVDLLLPVAPPPDGFTRFQFAPRRRRRRRGGVRMLPPGT